jgi:hypothetical protein
MLLLFGLVGVGCATDDRPTETADADATTTTKETSSDAESTTTTSGPTTSQKSEPDCLDTTTTTRATKSTSLPSVCELIGEIPPDERSAEEAHDYVVWSGTISGTIQTPGCDAVSQSGEIILVVFSDGELSGAGETVAGAYRCDNGASIPEMTNSYGIDGRKTGVFTLTFSDDVQLESGPIESGHARIIQDTGFGLVTIELVCKNC